MLRKLQNSIFNSLTEFSDAIPDALICLRSIRNSYKQIINFECVLLNKQAKELFEKSNEHTAGKLYFPSEPTAQEVALLSNYASVVNSGKPFSSELIIRQNSGTLSYASAAMKYGDGLVITYREITDDNTIAKPADDLKLILETIPQIAWTAAPDGSITYFNKRYFDYTGLNRSQVDNWEWKLVIHPAMLEQYMQAMRYSLHTGENFYIESLFKRSEDNTYRWHLSQAVPVRNDQGEITLWVGTSTDINDHKETRNELENLVLERTREVMHSNEELELSNIKLEEFAFVASHDLKEPLRKIITNSDFLRMEFFDQLVDRGKEYIHNIQKSAFKMQKLIDDLLSFSQLTYSEVGFEKIDLGELVTRIIAELPMAATDPPPQITIKRLPVIECIPSLMEQLFNNLISNALKFIIPGTVPSIVVSYKNISGIYTGIANALPREKYCRIYVKDNGIGFNNKYVEQIFIIFKRLNSQRNYQGTGIGLALCKKIVENHRGSITAKSKVNKGATFVITLPYLQKI